ncbi:transcriptional regulator GcvA [Aggregatibacter aphrophilus]|uniref:Gcv operon activator n=2 Tax=Aggregatibacter aphrophilus TaxID=732 RepID=A0A336N1G5_AGGAP|nr:transcriptional regulator GcvA [Aggregatibacter aphrophilus]KNE85466.1 transcriptional regulator [Aggregatibacter aphrophilus ATCC 33389]OBY54398.1 transcriptional regulator [Aggregatibacter aphrophilus]RDE89005.1 transcriptional regulator GcvA [Aggregatibacter aphrophilus]SSY92913.1 Gcv operon activator [Aggregatibacter aphrophilus]VEF44185.1 Gcv operon activator [Aggregatibacter aphrophilus ATCC 33389]
MYKRLPPLNSLKAFESAARFLSFTKAANELFVTQAAISHQIKILEDFLGVELFKRKNRALELTEFGKAYYVDITKILHRLVEATDKLLSLKSDKHLTISVPQTFGIQWLVPRLSEFNKLHPDIEVRLKGVDQDEGLLSQDIDIAIYYGRGNWDNLQVDRLVEEKLLVLAAPKLLAEKPIHDYQDLKHHTLLHIHTRDNWQYMADYLLCDELNIQQGPIFSHTFMALQAAIHAQGVVLANRILAQQELDNGNLALVFDTNLRDPKSFYVVNHLDNSSDERIIAFRTWIIQTMNQEENK